MGDEKKKTIKGILKVRNPADLDADHEAAPKPKRKVLFRPANETVFVEKNTHDKTVSVSDPEVTYKLAAPITPNDGWLICGNNVTINHSSNLVDPNNILTLYNALHYLKALEESKENPSTEKNKNVTVVVEGKTLNNSFVDNQEFYLSRPELIPKGLKLVFLFTDINDKTFVIGEGELDENTAETIRNYRNNPAFSKLKNVHIGKTINPFQENDKNDKQFIKNFLNELEKAKAENTSENLLACVSAGASQSKETNPAIIRKFNLLARLLYARPDLLPAEVILSLTNCDSNTGVKFESKAASATDIHGLLNNPFIFDQKTGNMHSYIYGETNMDVWIQILYSLTPDEYEKFQNLDDADGIFLIYAAMHVAKKKHNELDPYTILNSFRMLNFFTVNYDGNNTQELNKITKIYDFFTQHPTMIPASCSLQFENLCTNTHFSIPRRGAIDGNPFDIIKRIRENDLLFDKTNNCIQPALFPSDSKAKSDAYLYWALTTFAILAATSVFITLLAVDIIEPVVNEIADSAGKFPLYAGVSIAGAGLTAYTAYVGNGSIKEIEKTEENTEASKNQFRKAVWSTQ